jgi:hypothetical protein
MHDFDGEPFTTFPREKARNIANVPAPSRGPMSHHEAYSIVLGMIQEINVHEHVEVQATHVDMYCVSVSSLSFTKVSVKYVLELSQVCFRG